MVGQRTNSVTRRGFLRNVSCASAAAYLSGSVGLAGRVHAAETYPSRDIDVFFGTAPGGGTDRVIRSIAPLFEEKLGTRLKYSYHPGAGGEVGWTLFSRKDPDGYSFFGSVISIDLLTFAIQQPKGFKYPDDVFFFASVNQDPTCLATAANGRFKSLAEAIEAAKTREVTVGLSRWTQTANIGVQAINDALGTRLVGVPYGGGGKARAAMLSGEVDLGGGPLGPIIGMGPDARVLVLFDDENRFRDRIGDVPVVNQALGLDLPPLSVQIGFAAHTALKKRYPERLAAMEKAIQATLADPRLPRFAGTSGYDLQTYGFWGEERCATYASRFSAVVNKYKQLLARP